MNRKPVLSSLSRPEVNDFAREARLAHDFVGFGVATGAAQSISGDYREVEPKRTPASPLVDGGLPLGDFLRARRLLKVDDLILDEASWPAYENGSCRADGVHDAEAGRTRLGREPHGPKLAPEAAVECGAHSHRWEHGCGQHFVPSSAIQRLDGLLDCSLVSVGSDYLEISAANSSSTPSTHFNNGLASDKATELGDEATVAADGEGPVASGGVDHIRQSRLARRIRGPKRKWHKGVWAVGAGPDVRSARIS